MKKWECTVCGYIHVGDEPPDECPVCSADKSMFVEVVEEQNPAETAAAPETAPQPQPTVPPSLPAKIYALASALTVRYHLHPIMVHTPNGVVPMALVFMLITVWFGLPLFETAALYSLVFVLVSMPMVLFTGYVMWQQRYRGAFTSIFKIKIGASIAAVVLLLGLVIWRAVQPDIASSASTGRWIYLFCCLLLVGVVGTAGHFGGKLVFGSRKD
ncbi:MAG: rubredoxin-type Fe(Cys)4 protein [Desulfobulbus sp.]|jgi:rubredoxin/uncharacterized membrane protein|uniref:DUF2231 domain-containing protein n=1 Tax=Desulfobulbus sp. TaxID=895 RepID=UPI00283B31A8|nr:DUF2231 domain-containing protein [Desulfobulbus sp.]MDR2551280.1 rubredoxin-type Fe(Cys)4 protein [Desulfobulbus sp.]